MGELMSLGRLPGPRFVDSVFASMPAQHQFTRSRSRRGQRTHNTSESMSKDQLPAVPVVELHSLETLRASLGEATRTGATAWIRLRGLDIDDAMAHSALCNTLERLGLARGAAATPPQLVVLDWSTVGECSAEGVAFFATLAQQFVRDGVRVIVPEPAVEAIRGILTESGLRAGCEGLEWVPCEASGRGAGRSVARAAIFSALANESVDDFCDDLSATLEELRVPRVTARAVTGTTFEMVHNVLSHAAAPHGAAIALLFPRRRPKILQVGIADNGLGIPEALLRHPRHEWLGWFSDAEVTTRVLSGNLSGRGAEEGGGGLARAVKRMLTETPSRLLLRSGAALITLESSSPERFIRRRLTYGTGTQIRMEFQIG